MLPKKTFSKRTPPQKPFLLFRKQGIVILFGKKSNSRVTILAVKALEKIVKDRRALVFLDLEGTQLSHEMIEIGAYLATLNDDLSVKKIYPGFKNYVLATHPIGPVVVKMTGITERLLQKEGRKFSDVEKDFKHYVGRYWEKCLFVTFGSHDLRIVSQSALLSPDSDKNIAHNICHFDFDYSLFLSHYIQDANSNPLSLANYLKIFDVPFEGKAHDALVDAYNLIDLYTAFLKRPDITKKEYKKTLSHVNHAPAPINKIIAKLNTNETVTPAMWDNIIAESLK